MRDTTIEPRSRFESLSKDVPSRHGWRSSVLFCIARLIDLHRGGHPGHESEALRHLVDVDTHRNPLREPHPGEDRINRGDPLSIRLCVRDIDLTRDAVDMATQDRAVAHQLYFSRIPNVDRREVGLLEISIDPK